MKLKLNIAMIIAIFLGLIINLSFSNLSADFAGGDGSEGNPFLVANAAQLNMIRNYLTYNFRLISNIVLSDYSDNEGWEPIGSYVPEYPFQGSLDGDGYIISNLFIDRETSGTGLFGYTENALLSNIIMFNVEVTGINDVGSLAGKTYNTEIINTDLQNITINGESNTGGLVGHFEAEDKMACYIIDSYLQGTVNGSSDRIGGLAGSFHGEYSFVEDCHTLIVVNGNNQVGGLAGEFNGSSIIDSFSSGSVNGHEEVGGLTGLLYTSIVDSGSDADLTGVNMVGGLIGAGGKYIRDSFSTGLVDATGDKAGGLVGSCELGSSVILRCFSTSDVTALGDNVGGLAGKINDSLTQVSLSYASGNVTGNNYVGGLFGYNYSGVYVANCYASGSIEGNDYVGGLIGYNDTYYTYLSPGYTHAPLSCYATGDVSGSNIVGGLIGFTNGGIINVMRNELRNLYATGNVTGDTYVGGLIGENFGAHIIYTYSTGLVETNEGGIYIGGLIGRNHGGGEVSYSYWDLVTSKQPDSAGGEGKITVDLVRDRSDLYANWDFTNVWTMTDYTTYPYLQWQNEPGIHNYPPNGYHKIFCGRGYYWESFPVLWNRDANGDQCGREVLEPLTYHTYIQVQNDIYESMEWDGENWSEPHIFFNSTRGYQISFLTSDEFNLIVNRENALPENEPFDSVVTIFNDREVNWVGYFIPQTQCAFAAFSGIIDDLESVKSEEWSIWRYGEGPDDWISNFANPKVEFGKMYMVVTREYVTEDLDLVWNLPTEEEYRENLRNPEYFTYEEKSDYEAFFIVEIEDDEDVLEVAVYAGDDCVGASVFEGVYPLEILAYTDMTHIGEDFSFAVHRQSERGETAMIRVAGVKDLETGEFSDRVLKPLRQRFSIVRLGSGDFEPVPVVTPEVILSQNYPNPFLYSEESRSHLTEIPFFVAESREVTLKIYNIRGQLVKTLFSGTASAGKHSIGWNGHNEHNRRVGSGIYFYRLESGEQALTRKMLLIR